jgi:hypothetical protein
MLKRIRIAYNCTEEQAQKAIDAIGDESYFPKFTNDPVVNWIVDCLICGNEPYDPSLYEKEIELSKGIQ